MNRVLMGLMFFPRGGLSGRVTALLCGISASAISSQAIAQAPSGDDQVLTQVVVTGSRIVRAGYDTLEPASVISGEYIQSRGLTNIADALNESPLSAPITVLLP